MDVASDFAAWAWARHHNEWSWYIRPMFIIPFCWFAWRRTLAGIVLTLVALATSMFWFPAPVVPSPMAVEVLAAERAYLVGEWTWWKIVIALLIPASLTALATAFWQRSFGWGILVVNLMVIMKVAWSFVFFSREGAFHHLVPAALGLAICNAILLAAARWRRRPAKTLSTSLNAP